MEELTIKQSNTQIDTHKLNDILLPLTIESAQDRGGWGYNSVDDGNKFAIKLPT